MRSPMKPASCASASAASMISRLLLVLAADVDEGLVRARRVGADDDALDEHVRALLHELAVLERARLGLVGVADEVLVDVRLRDERDLLAAREARAAAAAQAGGEQLVEHRLGRHLASAPCAPSRSRRAGGRRRSCAGRARRCRRRGSSGSHASSSSFAGGCSIAAGGPTGPPPIGGRRSSSARRVGGAGDRARGAGVGALAQAQLLVGQRRHAVADLLDEPRHLVERDRADVDAVDRGHRRDVAGAEALEAAHVEVRVAGGLLAQPVVAARRRRTASRRCSCRRRPSGARRGASRACRRTRRPR